MPQDREYGTPCRHMYSCRSFFRIQRYKSLPFPKESDHLHLFHSFIQMSPNKEMKSARWNVTQLFSTCQMSSTSLNKTEIKEDYLWHGRRNAVLSSRPNLRLVWMAAGLIFWSQKLVTNFIFFLYLVMQVPRPPHSRSLCVAKQ